jgi:diguanylate cyclase (GGDEF)-like protein
MTSSKTAAPPKLTARIHNLYRFIVPSALLLPFQQKRIDVLQLRIRSLAWILALSIPAWSLLDAFAFPHDLWVSLCVARLLGGAAFGFFLLFGGTVFKRSSRKLWRIYLQLGVIFVLPTLFYVYCIRLPDPVSVGTPFALAVTNSYYLLPFVILAFIGFFPLTLIESSSIVAPFLLAYYFTNEAPDISLWSADLGHIWVLIVMSITSIVISCSQLSMLIQLVSYSSYDVLTDCLGRRSGEEIVKALWHFSVRKNSNLAIALIDLDKFKLVNDCFGHQAGDDVLTQAAATIKKSLRKSDFVIRWGGEEFLIVMPDTKIDDATTVLARMAEKGICKRPDGSVQTASIGIAERANEDVADEHTLIQEADKRLYQAKIAGRHRVVSTQTIVLRS